MTSRKVAEQKNFNTNLIQRNLTILTNTKRTYLAIEYEYGNEINMKVNYEF